MGKIEYAVLTKAGGREENEDFVKVESCGERLCAVVADGLGGHGGGGVASLAATEAVMGCWKAGFTDTEEGIFRTVEKAHESVVGRQTESCRMKTTLVGLFITGNQAHWIHVGDSRLYYFEKQHLAECTKDHSVPQMALMMGMITEDQIRFHADRNRILRALGSENYEPELSGPRKWKEGRQAFLLCTDGFWEYVLEEEMEEALAGSASPKQWLGKMEEVLKSRASAGNDNYTAAAVFVLPIPKGIDLPNRD